MNKIQSFLHRFTNRGHAPLLSTPTAIIIGSVIIALGIVGYGYTSRPSEGIGSQDLVKVVAKELKLKGSKWDSCLSSSETAAQVRKELNDGVTAGVTGTPTTFVLVNKNGTYEVSARIEGAQPEGNVQQAIEQALAGNVKTTPFAGAPITADEFVQGRRDEVILLEYADAECPFCVRFHPVVTSMMEAYGDRIGFAYRHFPLTQIHPNAERYAAAIECAGTLKGPDAYFGFIDKLFKAEAQGQ